MPAAPSRDPVPAADVHAIPEQVARLRESFASGRTRPLAWRREQLDRMAAMLREHGDELVEALQADLRKPELEAWTSDVSIVQGDIATARKQLARWTRPQRVPVPLAQRPSRARIVREPLGVVLVIAPWNYPVQLLLLPAVGAIAAGNCMVLKPSEITAHTSAVLARRIPEYLDPACVAVVEGGVEETTALLEERFDHIFYTGGGGVARVVMEAAAKHLTPVTLELGGKSPCIVDKSANLDVAARRIAWGKFLNAGQTCIAPDYVLVHAAREAELIEKLGEAIRGFYGEIPHETQDFARIVNDRHFQRLAGLLEGADVAVGGETDAAQRYVAPTVLRNVAPEAPVMRDEIFGPILPVLPVADVREAIDFVNARPKPLALYLFTEERGAEEAVIGATSSGGACVNGTLWHVANWNLPFGGVGESGTGAYHGKASFETFSHRKSVVTKPVRPEVKMGYPPYGRIKTALVKRFS